MQAPRCLFQVCFEPLQKQPDDPKHLLLYVLSLGNLLDSDASSNLGLSTRAQWSEYLQSILLASSRLLVACSGSASPNWGRLSASNSSRLCRSTIEGLKLLTGALRNSTPELVSTLKHLSSNVNSAGVPVKLAELDSQLNSWFNRLRSTGLALLTAETARAGALNSTPAQEQRQLTAVRQLFEHLGVRTVQDASNSLAMGEEQFLRSLSAGVEADDRDCEVFRNCANQLRSSLRSVLNDLEAAAVAAMSAGTDASTTAAAEAAPALPDPVSNGAKRSFSRRVPSEPVASASSGARQCTAAPAGGTRSAYRRLLRCSLNTPAVSDSLADLAADAASTPSPTKKPMLRSRQQRRDAGDDDDDQQSQPDQQNPHQQKQMESDASLVVADRSLSKSNNSRNKSNRNSNESNSNNRQANTAAAAAAPSSEPANSSSISSDSSSPPNDAAIVQSSPASSPSRQRTRIRPVLDLSGEMRLGFSGSTASTARQRRVWNNRESFLLYIGHVRYGNSWVDIRNRLLNHATRTNVQLKDRWRNMTNKNIPGRLAQRLQRLGYSEQDVRLAAVEDLMQLLRSDLDLQSIFYS